MKIYRLFGALLFAATLSVQTVHAATVMNTNDSGAGSLRDALVNAPDGDTINFSVTTPATITLTTGELLVNKNFIISGPGADQLSVNGNAASRVFHIASGKTVTISGLTITNGSATGNHPDDFGGGIYSDHATLTVSDCTISGNSATSGAGIFSDGENSGSATLTVTNSTLSGNSTNLGVGGAIFNDGLNFGSATLTVTNSTLSGNSGGEGGGIFNGGGFHGSATLTVTNSTLSNNLGPDNGGGIFSDGENSGSATLTVTNSTLSGNSTNNNGGGIFSGGVFSGSATLTINNSTFSGNSATAIISGGSGGGIYNQSALTINNSTFSGNSATNGGGGVFNTGVLSGSATLTLGSTIFKTGALGENIFNDSGSVTSLGYNLSSDDAAAFLNQTGDQNSTDPMLGPLQDKGGPTFTHALLTGSPAIDKGKNFSGSTTDQRGIGFARTFDNPSIPNATGGDGTDIGAFEVQTIPPCPQPQGYWKNNPDAWPVDSLTLGSQTYTKTELLTILTTPTKADASLILADQLIAAKLNIANGSGEPAPVPSTITHADSVLSGFSGKLPYHVKASSPNGQAMVTDATTLDNYNNGLLTSGCTL